jgi:hypothetical protein
VHMLHIQPKSPLKLKCDTTISQQIAKRCAICEESSWSHMNPEVELPFDYGNQFTRGIPKAARSSTWPRPRSS